MYTYEKSREQESPHPSNIIEMDLFGGGEALVCGGIMFGSSVDIKKKQNIPYSYGGYTELFRKDI